jgi:hypothetical protein
MDVDVDHSGVADLGGQHLERLVDYLRDQLEDRGWCLAGTGGSREGRVK